MGRVPAILLLFLGAGTLVAGVGLLRRKRWAWWFAVVLFLINGAGDVVSAIVTGDWLRSAAGVVLCSVFVWSLNRPPVRRYLKP